MDGWMDGVCVCVYVCVYVVFVSTDIHAHIMKYQSALY